MGDGGGKEFFDCRAAAELLAFDLIRVARTIGLDASRLARILGTDVHDAEAMLSGRRLVSPDSPVGQRCVRLVRLLRALGDAFGSTDAVAGFLACPDPEDGVIPAEILEESDGIERVFARLSCLGEDEWRPPAYAPRREAGVLRDVTP